MSSTSKKRKHSDKEENGITFKDRMIKIARDKVEGFREYTHGDGFKRYYFIEHIKDFKFNVYRGVGDENIYQFRDPYLKPTQKDSRNIYITVGALVPSTEEEVVKAWDKK